MSCSIDKDLERLYIKVGFLQPTGENEDCSESAERAKEVLGRGRIITFVACRPDGYVQEFYTPGGLSSNKWLYHTVLLVTISGKRYIVDITSTFKVAAYEEYIRALKACNGGIAFKQVYGGVPEFVLRLHRWVKARGEKDI